MSNAERPLQIDMFTGGLVDTRTRNQKQHDQEQARGKQELLFSQRDLAQFGVTPRPLLPLADHTRLALERPDVRSEEEKARDVQRAAQERTVPLFSKEPEQDGEYLLSQQPTPITDPRRLLAAQSTASGRSTSERADPYHVDESKLRRQVNERLLYLRMIHELHGYLR